MGIAQLFGIGCEPKATEYLPVFVRNISAQELDRSVITGGFAGRARASGLDGVEMYTAERNAADGYQGLYRTGPSSKLTVVPKR